jgi:hypothetical protein
VIIHGGEPRHRPNLRSSRSRRQSGPCLHHAMSDAAPGAGEHFQPPDWLPGSNMFSVHSKPNGQTRLADHNNIRKVGTERRSDVHCQYTKRAISSLRPLRGMAVQSDGRAWVGAEL